jgi:hypothetical protein
MVVNNNMLKRKLKKFYPPIVIALPEKFTNFLYNFKYNWFIKIIYSKKGESDAI